MTIIEKGQKNSVPVAAAIGMFDGVHIGHRYMIGQLRKLADERGLASAAITFPCHPRSVLRPEEAVPMLMTVSDKLAALAAAGLGYAVVLDFDMALARLSAKEFIRLIRDEYCVKLLLVGYDHRFGHDRRESVADYVEYGKELGVEVVRCREFLDSEGRKVASSVIRNMIATGNMEQAARLMAQPFRLKGTVVGGFRNGRKLGFPTANICVGDSSLIIPANGVYAVRVVLASGERHGGMLNIGCRPTVGGVAGKVSVEVNIFGFSADIYGEEIAVDFLCRMRAEKKWASVDELKEQLAADRRKAEEILLNYDI